MTAIVKNYFMVPHFFHNILVLLVKFCFFILNVFVIVSYIFHIFCIVVLASFITKQYMDMLIFAQFPWNCCVI